MVSWTKINPVAETASTKSDSEFSNYGLSGCIKLELVIRR